MILLLLLLLLLYSDRMGRVWPKTKAISMLDLENNQTLHILKKKKKKIVYPIWHIQPIELLINRLFSLSILAASSYLAGEMDEYHRVHKRLGSSQTWNEQKWFVTFDLNG